MLTIKIHINNETRKSIKNVYDKDDFKTVDSVVDDIVERYLDVEHFDPELSTDENDSYTTCASCGEKSKISKMVDVDGRNIEEYAVCENCGNGYPVLR